MANATANTCPTIFDGRRWRQIWQPGDGNGDPNVEILEAAFGTKKGHPTWKIFTGNVEQIKRGVNEPPNRCYLDDKAAYDILRSKAFTNVEKHRYWPFDFAINGFMRAGRKNRGRPAYEPGDQNIIASVPRSKGYSQYFFYGAAGPSNAESSRQTPTLAPSSTTVEARHLPASTSTTPKQGTPAIMQSIESDPPESPTPPVSPTPKKLNSQARQMPDVSPRAHEARQHPHKEAPKTASQASARATRGDGIGPLNLGSFMGAPKLPKRSSSTVPREVDREVVPVSPASSPRGVLPETVPALPGVSGPRVPIKAPAGGIRAADLEPPKPVKRRRAPSPTLSSKRLRNDVHPRRSASAFSGIDPQQGEHFAPEVEPTRTTFGSLKDQITKLQKDLDNNKVECDTRIAEFGKLYHQLDRLEQEQENNQAELAAARTALSAAEKTRDDLAAELAEYKGRLDTAARELLRLKQDNDDPQLSAASLPDDHQKNHEDLHVQHAKLQQELAVYKAVARNLYISLSDAKADMVEGHTALDSIEKTINAVGMKVKKEMKESQGLHAEVSRALSQTQEDIDNAGMAAEWEALVGQVMKH